MSLAGVLVLTVVVLVLLVGWLAAVFLAARQPGGARPGNEDPARGRQPEAVTHRGDMPAGTRVHPPDGHPGQPAGGGGTGEPLARGTGQAPQPCPVTLWCRRCGPALRLQRGLFPWLVANIINC
jgi:hypothetical protein